MESTKSSVKFRDIQDQDMHGYDEHDEDPNDLTDHVEQINTNIRKSQQESDEEEKADDYDDMINVCTILLRNLNMMLTLLLGCGLTRVRRGFQEVQ